jgi:cardiolipin synthase
MAGSGRTDVPITRWASQHIYHTLLRRGVETIEFVSPTLRAMTGTIDGLYSSIGSFNWDRLSVRRNLEVNLTVLDPAIGTMMASHFDAHLQSCTRVSVESLKTRNVSQRLRHRVASDIMRWPDRV